MNLDDIVCMRCNHLTRLLAGCVAIDPVRVLVITDRLRVEQLSDVRARRFILCMRDQLPSLRAANLDEQVNIAVRTAQSNGLSIDYLKWITMPVNARKDAESAVTELQCLAITLSTLESLKDWIEECEFIGAYHEH